MGQQQLAQSAAAGAVQRIGEAHVEFHEELRRAVEVVVVPDVHVAQQPHAPVVVGDVHDEPEFLHRCGGQGREVEAVELQQGEDVGDDGFAEGTHAQVFEAGHPADLGGLPLVGPGEGIWATEGAVAVEGEGEEAFRVVVSCVVEERGGKALVCEVVVGARDGVEVEEVGEREVG